MKSRRREWGDNGSVDVSLILVCLLLSLLPPMMTDTIPSHFSPLLSPRIDLYNTHWDAADHAPPSETFVTHNQYVQNRTSSQNGYDRSGSRSTSRVSNRSPSPSPNSAAGSKSSFSHIGYDIVTGRRRVNPQFSPYELSSKSAFQQAQQEKAPRSKSRRSQVQSYNIITCNDM